MPWSLATADDMPVKIDKSRLLHNLESSIEPTTARTSDAVHIIDGNAMLQSLKPIPDTFEELAEHVFNRLPKLKLVDFTTDTYKPQSIKFYERACRGMAPTFLLSGARTKTPHEWKSFMSNDKNKTQLINLLLEQWKTDKYAAKLVDRSIYYVIGEKVYRLTSEDGRAVSAYSEESFSSQEEADTRIILHCLSVSNSLPQRCCITVRSPDTDVLVLLAKYCKDIKNKILFDTGMGNKRRLVNVNDIHKNKGEDICSVLPA